jgi:hypothetical protein
MHARHARQLQRLLSTTVAVTAVALVAGCGDDKSKSDSAAKEAPTPTTFAVVAPAGSKKKLTMDFPATVKSGLVTLTLKNNDTRPRGAEIIRLEGNHTVQDFLDAVDETDGAPIPDWIQDGGGVPEVEPGGTRSATQVLAPGRYGIYDDGGPDKGPDNDDLGAKGEFTVTGPASDAELPAQPATITASDYTYAFKGLKAGTNHVRFENIGKEIHHALFFPLAKGATFADAKKLFTSDSPPKGPPPVDFHNGVGTTVIDGGIAQNTDLDLKAGKYAVVCFIQDRKGGAPHVAKGMISELSVE